MTKCKFVVKNGSFEMLVVFSPIFVADTKITFVYNFVAPLKAVLLLLTMFLSYQYLFTKQLWENNAYFLLERYRLE